MLGKKITELRKEKGLSQKMLAEILEITPQAVSVWEKDKTDPDIINIKRLALFFDVSTDYLLGLED